MTQFAGTVAVVTGASEGIGKAIALEIARQGAQVVVMARSEAKLASVVDEITREGGKASYVVADLCAPQAVRLAMMEAVARHGPIDVLVNNVGAGTFKPLHLTSELECDMALALPLVPAVVASQAVLPGMLAKRRGHIVNLTSPAGLMPMPYMAPYTAARHAMVALSRGLAGELDGTGVHVSLVCPSQVDTGYFLNNDADMRWYPPISTVFPVLTPERVAKEVVAAILQNKREVVFPWQLRWAMRMYSVAPAVSQAFMKACGLWHRGLAHAAGTS